MKKPDLLVQVAAGLAACSAHRQIARSAGCAKTSVTRMAERLGRHAILFNARVKSELAGISEPIVHDHFETFIGRQDHALAIGTAVGSRSWFVYDVDPAPHRGSGRRPDRKEREAERVPRPYIESIRRTIRGLKSRISVGRPVEMAIDGRRDYTIARRIEGMESAVSFRIHPNPERGPKGAPRTAEAVERDLAMFPVDQLQQLLRHTCSDHKRETISFGRRLESILGRAHLMAVWKNFIKARSERAPDRSTPAMRLGLTDVRWTWARVLSRRLFSQRLELSDSASLLYSKRWTKALPPLDRKHAA